MTSPRFTVAKARVRKAVEEHLSAAFEAYPPSEVRDAARYAVLGSGHRWRALVAIAAGEVFHANASTIVLPAACGVELAHAASMVLDDMPSMDDAAVRRGKPATHLAFLKWAADMAPMFLITMAYQILLDNPHASPERRVYAALLFSGAGLDMIGGQVKDIKQEHASDEKRLLQCYTLKTGALYAAAAKAGAILAGASEADAQRMHVAGLNLGLSVQLLDDIADVVAGVTEVGKKSGMDRGKWTAIDWLGVDGARAKSLEFQSAGLTAIEPFGREADWLRSLIGEASWATS